MKAVRFHRTGGPEVLVYEDVADVTPKEGEMIRIEAVGLNLRARHASARRPFSGSLGAALRFGRGSGGHHRAYVTAFSQESGAEVKSKLHRHVDARHAGRIDFDARQVVNAPVAVPNHGGDFADPNLSAIGRAQSAARVQPERIVVKTIARKMGLNPSSNGQLMKTALDRPPGIGRGTRLPSLLHCSRHGAQYRGSVPRAQAEFRV